MERPEKDFESIHYLHYKCNIAYATQKFRSWWFWATRYERMAARLSQNKADSDKLLLQISRGRISVLEQENEELKRKVNDIGRLWSELNGLGDWLKDDFTNI